MRLKPSLLTLALSFLTLLGSARYTQADLATGRALIEKGDWKGAETELRKAADAEQGAARLLLGELHLLSGRLDEAREEAVAALQHPASGEGARLLLGRVALERGDHPAAIQAFEAVLAANPRAPMARAQLGRLQFRLGRPEAAKRTLLPLAKETPPSATEGKAVEQLLAAGIGAQVLRSWQDANTLLQAAAAKDPKHVATQLEWGQLFLSKYRADEAFRCFQDALRLWPRHPEALVFMAQARLEERGDVAGARKLADQALEVNPRCASALNFKARLALDDDHFEAAEKLLSRVLETNPRNLDALTLLAASAQLQDDQPRFARYKKEVLTEYPRCSAFFLTLGELAVRGHRYAEAVELYRTAVAIDPADSDALAGMGINLLRLGAAREAEGLKAVDQAFQLDSFNVRTFNTLNLFEKVIPKEYDTVRPTADSPFVYRMPKKERPLLERYLPGVMQSTWQRYVEKYGFTPKQPVTVELFAERQHYGARTTGLPEIGAQGTCFGELITAMSPASAEASWELVLSHELAHVFHLQLSRNRVPRWFTEGLAEYETNVAKRHWKRSHSLELYHSLKRGDLWKVTELSAAFTHPNRPNGVVLAYHQSSLVIHYLVETCGFPKVVAALKRFAEGAPEKTVLEEMTGKSLEATDAGFRAFLVSRFPVYERGFQFDPGAYADLAALKADAAARMSDANAQAAYAAGLLGVDAAAALKQARQALEIDPKQPLGRFVLASALERTKDLKGAGQQWEALLADGVDGIPIRIALARVKVQAGEPAASVAHLRAAKDWDPEDSVPVRQLLSVFEKAGDRDNALKEAEALLEREPHDHAVARLLLDRLATDAQWDDLVRIAPRVLELTPNEVFVHQIYGQALARRGRHREAAFELESALIGGVRRPGRLRAQLARQLLLFGNLVGARAAAMQALKEEPGNQEAEAVLREAK
jgi:tetratricopeptide (TPR) repeat protein